MVFVLCALTSSPLMISFVDHSDLRYSRLVVLPSLIAGDSSDLGNKLSGVKYKYTSNTGIDVKIWA